ncbi:MAG: hypothetical protein JW963_19800 [Anaerolineales bacterium]|nr:hypothetical protein [Anaerolineales bacterium]
MASWLRIIGQFCGARVPLSQSPHVLRSQPVPQEPGLHHGLDHGYGLTTLLVFALAERQLRLRLNKENASVPSQTGRLTRTPTTRWFFQMFEGLDLLLIMKNEKVVARKVLNLKPHHLVIIRLLGPQVQYCVSPPD